MAGKGVNITAAGDTKCGSLPCRYYHARYVLLDRSRKLRRIRLRDLSQRPLLAPLYSATAAGRADGTGAGGGGEGADDEVESPESRCWSQRGGLNSSAPLAAAAVPAAPLPPLPDVIPLSGGADGGGGGGSTQQLGSSAAEYLRLTGDGQAAAEEASPGETAEEYILRR